MQNKGKCCSAVTSSSPVKWGINLRYSRAMEFIGCARFSVAYLFIKKAGAAIFTPWLIVPWVVEVDEPIVKVNQAGDKTDMGVGWWAMVEEPATIFGWAWVKVKETDSKEFYSNLSSLKWMGVEGESCSKKESSLEISSNRGYENCYQEKKM